MALITFMSTFLSFFTCFSCVAFEYMSPDRLQPKPLFKLQHENCSFESERLGLHKQLGKCQIFFDSFPMNSARFGCHISQFQCLTALDQNICSSLSADCSKQHCQDGSDIAFCSLQSSFWHLGSVPSNVSAVSQPYLDIWLQPMPLPIKQWLLASNSSLFFSVLIYKTIGHHVTSLVQSVGPAAYPSSATTIKLSGPVSNDSNQSPFIGYAVVVDLSVESFSPRGIEAVAVWPALTRRFVSTFKPPRVLADVEIRSFAVYDVQKSAAELTSRVRVQIEASNPVSNETKKLSIPFGWRCHDNKETKGFQLLLLEHSTDGLKQRRLLGTIVALENVSNTSNCQFWTTESSNVSDQIKAGVSTMVPEFTVELDFLNGVNATMDGGLEVAWRVPADSSRSYPPQAYNFTIDYWPHLCGKGGASVNGLNKTRAKLGAELLNPATRYWVSIRACDPAGCGPRSGYATALTVGPPIPPVDLVSADLSNGTNLLVRWRVGPVSDQWPLGKSWLVSLYYDTNVLRLICSDTLATDTNVEQSISSRIRLDHLQGCSLYAMRVQVTDSAGYGPASPIYLQATGLSSTSPPKNVRYTYPYDGNNTMALITWNAPCVIVFTPVAYVLKVTNMFTEETREFYIDATADSVISQLVDELESGTLYRLMVLTNSVGGQSSVPVVLKTDSFVGIRNLLAQLTPSSPTAGSCLHGGSSSSGATPASKEGCQISVRVRWVPDLPLTAHLIGEKPSTDIQIQYEIYGKVHQSAAAAAAGTSSVGELWHRYTAGVNNPGMLNTSEVVFKACVPACPPALLSYEIRTRVLIQYSKNEDSGAVIRGAFSRSTLLDLAADSSLITPPSCDSGTDTGDSNYLLRLGLLVAGSVTLAITMLGSGLVFVRRRLLRRRLLRRSQLLLSEAYDDASGNLFPEHAATFK